MFLGIIYEPKKCKIVYLQKIRSREWENGIEILIIFFFLKKTKLKEKEKKIIIIESLCYKIETRS